MISQKYPDAYDISELISLRTTNPTAIRAFAAVRGMLVAGKGREPIANCISRLLLDHKSCLDLRYYAQGGVSRTSVSGFNVRDLSTPPKTVEQVYEDIMRFRAELAQKRRTGSRKTLALEVEAPQIINQTIQARYTYNRVVPGKIELLAHSDETVDFTITPIAEGIWRVLCLPKYNQDVETLQKLFTRINKISYEVYTISLDKFPVDQRIAFFDRLLEYYSQPLPEVEWRLRQVRGIVVKQSDKTKAVEEEIFEIDSDLSLNELIEADDESVERVRVTDLRSITKAALEGENLRTNSFVQNCENAGFFFSSMTLELKNKNTPEVIHVQIRFKELPKIFEVILHKTAYSTEIGEQEVRFEPERDQQILEEFWKTSHMIWHDVDADLPTSTGKQSQTVMNLV